MTWIMTGWSPEKERVEVRIEADSMDEAFEKARAIYGDGISGAQPAED